MRLFNVLCNGRAVDLSVPRPMWLWKLREFWRYRVLRKKRPCFEETYSVRIWDALNESITLFHEIKKIPWGPAVGWRNRTGGGTQDYLISKYFRGGLEKRQLIAPSGDPGVVIKEGGRGDRPASYHGRPSMGRVGRRAGR